MSFWWTLKYPKPMRKLTTQQEIDFPTVTFCHILEKSLQPSDCPVRDHFRLTDEYCAYSHQSYNVNCTDIQSLPVISYNLWCVSIYGFDGHFLVKSLATGIERNISLLSINKEKFIVNWKYYCQFEILRSFRFMASSLEQLSSYLKDDQRVITKKIWNNNDEFKLLQKKGIFPY